nr:MULTISPECIES: FtsK/SpoIIIE domain-containing protein [Microbacterium]
MTGTHGPLHSAEPPGADEPLRLPTPPAPVSRPPLPLMAAIVPVVGAVVLWRVTGSMFALWFAALGPLMAAASVLDGLRGRRKQRRAAAREADAAFDRADASLRRRHDRERHARWVRYPDVAGYARTGDDVWRAVPGRGDALVIGRGLDASAVRVSGGDDTARARDLRRRAQRLDDAPVTVPLHAGVAVVGPPTPAAAVVRALALQVCLAQPPGTVRVLDEGTLCPPGLPHAHGGRTLYAGDAGRRLPNDIDIPLVRVAPGAPPPPRCAAVLTLTGADTARLDHDGTSRDVRVEAVSAGQAAAVAEALRDRAATLAGAADAPTTLTALLDAAPRPHPSSLAAPIGTTADRPAVLDLVADGPHAIVIGVTGSGKSELLTSWIVALCAAHTPSDVCFLLVDFKGGRTFDALEPLPHVTGVLTDLDETAALRAVESLRAEIRHRERVLADADARDVAEADGALPRLVIVVDEYAALVAAHPALHELFGDIAARGRALGMHLVLASQRAAGVFRDAVLANAPLRISLRVADAGDSRAVLGTDEAALLSGAADAVGTALVRRAADSAARTVRVARCEPGTIAALAVRHAGAGKARRPWLPALPEKIPLQPLRRPEAIVLGVADEPEHQRQPTVVLDPGEPGLVVVGQAGAGRTTVLRAIAAQAARQHWVGGSPEQAWDAIGEITAAERGTVVLVDDVDALLTRLPGDYAIQAAERLERSAREARARGILLVLSTQRLGGPVARIADLLPRRLLLALPSRADHVAAGGDSRDHVPDAPPGRGRWGRTLLQVADPGDAPAASIDDLRHARGQAAACHYPGRRATAFVTPGGAATRAVLREWMDAGVPTHALDEVAAAGTRKLPPGAVVWGPPDAWLAQWRMLALARTDADLLVDAACAAEYRSVTGSRDLPPFALAGAGRAWLHRADRDEAVRRVLLPGPAPETRAAAGRR